MFLETFVSGEQDLAVCARKAYGDTLKRYHGWMVQGIFSVSVKYLGVLSRVCNKEGGRVSYSL